MNNEQGTRDEIDPDDDIMANDLNTDRNLLPKLIGDRPQDDYHLEEEE